MISDDLIETYLNNLFGSSAPGDDIHSLVFSVADDFAGRTALGVIPSDKVEVRFHAIVPTVEVDGDHFIAQTITRAIAEAQADKKVVHFAGLAIEANAVVDDGSEVTENRARRLMADRKLQEHPAAIELTRLYAACRDGRRWTGEHYLTGPKAGTIDGPHLRMGGLAPEEVGPHQWLVRLAVGL